ncbi:hypothetical protein L6164_026230 [Bauhinia variegata]|uniref:Uncharacterized protein n=1 Tax=Bauhinia variegata TaxID=167791 RepID=A0ACB9LQ32_BAUVA|nr:hypothetical protein L6164_026230 [Bauhinia variegata]
MLTNCHENCKPIAMMIIVKLALAFVNLLMKKVLNEGMSYLTIIAYRQAISAIFLAPIACLYERKNKLEIHIICLLFLSALVGVTLTQYLFLLGLKYTSATFSCAFLNMVPVFTFIMALPFGIEKVYMKSKSGKAKVLGTCVSISGALLLISYKGMPLINPQSHHTKNKATSIPSDHKLEKWLIGSILLTAASLLWSSWFLIQVRISKRYPCQYSSTAILSLFSAIQSAILSLVIERQNATWILKGKMEIMSVIYGGLVGSGLCYVAMSWCVKQKGPVFTAAFTPLIQIFVAVLDFSILQEEIYLGRLPTRVLNKKTPFEGWFGYKPDLQNLEIFGCVCFSYVPQVKRDKLDKKAEPGVFIGYSNTSKAYRIFQPQNGKILVSRDVKFMEDQQWSWEKPIMKQLPEIPQLFDDDVDDIPVRGTRSLSEIYQLSNVAILEPAEFEEVEKDEKWINAMKEELKMIEKNDTWELYIRHKAEWSIVGAMPHLLRLSRKYHASFTNPPQVQAVNKHNYVISSEMIPIICISVNNLGDSLANPIAARPP